MNKELQLGSSRCAGFGTALFFTQGWVIKFGSSMKITDPIQPAGSPGYDNWICWMLTWQIQPSPWSSGFQMEECHWISWTLLILLAADLGGTGFGFLDWFWISGILGWNSWLLNFWNFWFSWDWFGWSAGCRTAQMVIFCCWFPASFGLVQHVGVTNATENCNRVFPCWPLLVGLIWLCWIMLIFNEFCSLLDRYSVWWFELDFG